GLREGRGSLGHGNFGLGKNPVGALTFTLTSITFEAL
ncbi:MAG: hypothetical protein RL706_1009, partial [Pseudomonadota bacterium]